MKDTHLIYRNFVEGTPQEGSQWRVKVDGHGEFAEPIISEGNLYVATVDDGYPKNCAITSLNCENGKVNWIYKTKNSVRNSFVISQNKLIAQDIEGRVYCLDSKTGEVIWIKETKIMAAANTGQNVVVDDGRVYCGGAQKTVCLSLDNGDLIWEKSNDNACSSPCRMIIDGDKLIVGAN